MRVRRFVAVCLPLAVPAVMYGEGISEEADLLGLAVDRRIVDKSGTWFGFSGGRLGQGRENAKQFMKGNPVARQAIADRVRKELGLIEGRGGGGGLESGSHVPSPSCAGSGADS